MLNNLEQKAAAECIRIVKEIRSDSAKMLGVQTFELSSHEIQGMLVNINMAADDIDKWIRAMMENSCNCED